KVVVSYANYFPTSGPNLYQFYRIWNTSQEAYINLGNYRVSYFLNDSLLVGKYDAVTNPSAWDMAIDNQNDLSKYRYNPLTLSADQQIKFTITKLAKGKDANGRWNQKIVTQFAQVLSAPTSHLYDKADYDYLIHKGVSGPSLIRTKLEARPFADLSSKLTDDWSYSSSASSLNINGQTSRFFPVSPTYTNAATAFAPVVTNNFSKDVCNADVANFSKVLVEEFDGYTWRRVGGSAPVYGIDASNVVVYDTIPKHLIWIGFTDNSALGGTATYTAAPIGSDYTGIVKWSSNSLLAGDSASLAYKVLVKDPPCVTTDVNFVHKAWIKSDKDLLASAAGVVVKCTVTDIANTTLANVIELYPNPAHDQATVDLSQYRGKVYSVELKSTSGHVLQHFQNSNGHIVIATQSLATGVYLVEIKTDEGIVVKKLNVVK
ncbi:MAG TPA: T9SS type A sorting domain-containing protein, partial [Cytophagales bacterium]|nr:T9SS type A sorting domain-containing protein [Cytophagales bacterium]